MHGLSSVPAVTGGGGAGFSAAQKLSLREVLGGVTISVCKKYVTGKGGQKS